MPERYRNDYPDWMDEHDRDVHNEGMNSYYNGQHQDSNPHDKNSRDYFMWINGYIYAYDTRDDNDIILPGDHSNTF